MLVAFADLVGIVERLGRAGGNQRRRKQRLSEFLEQRLNHRVLRDPDAYRAPPGMLDPSRHFTGRGEQEGVTAGNALLHDPELPVIEQRVTPDLGHIAAHERQMMLVVDRAQHANALCGIGVADLTSERVTRIRRIGDHAARAHDLCRLSHQSLLRITGMNGKILSHERRTPFRFIVHVNRGVFRYII